MGTGRNIERIDPFAGMYQEIAQKRPREHYLARYEEIFESFPHIFRDLGQQARWEYFAALANHAFAPANLTDPWAAWGNWVHLASRTAQLTRGLLAYWDQERVKYGLREPGLTWRLGQNIAVTPKETIYQSELLKVYHYLAPEARGNGRQKGPVHRHPFFMLYSWINAYWILDLTPETSMLATLRQAGVDTYVTDWQRPKTREGFRANLDDYLGEVLAAADAVRRHSGEEELLIGGYCIGGVLADVLVALDPDRTVALLNLTTGLDTYAGEDGAGAFGAFTSFDVARLGEFAERHGGMLPQKAFGEFFDNVKPEKAVQGFVQTYLYGRPESDDPISYWNRRSARPAYPVHIEFLKRIYNDNELGDGPADGSPYPVFGGQEVDLRRITCPLQVICGRFDHIVPLPVALRTCHLVGTPPEDQEVLLIQGGHVRAIVNLDLYPRIAEFLTRHGGPRDRVPHS